MDPRIEQGRPSQTEEEKPTTKTTLHQPWKNSWPPKTVVRDGEEHGVERGGIIAQDGSSGTGTDKNKDVD